MKHRLLWHCRRSSARGYISPIPVHNQPRLHTSNIDNFNKKNGFTQEQIRSRQYPAQTYSDYPDDLALLESTSAQAESLLYSLEQAAGGIGLHVNAAKTEYMCFNQNQRGDFSSLKCGSLKLVGKFHLPRKQRVIYGKWREYATREVMDSYRSANDHMEVRLLR